MRRTIRAKREKEVYAQAQRQADLFEALQIGAAIMVILLFVGGLVYFAMMQKGMV